MAIARSLVIDIAMNIARMQQDITKAKKHFSSLEKSINGVAIAAAKVATAFYALRSSFDLAEAAANFDQAEQAFANLAASHGANSARIIENLDSVAAGTVSTANIMASAGKAMLLGIPADKLEELMSVARASARITGQSVQQAFDDIATGLGRQSKLILDNLGIVVSAGKANEEYAKSIGKAASELTDAEKKQAFMNAALKSGGEIVKRVNVTTLTAAEAMKKFNAQIDNAEIFLGKTIIAISSFVSAVALGISTMVHTVIAGVADMIAGMTEVIAKAPLIGEKFEGAAQGVRFFADSEKLAAQNASDMAGQQIEIAKAIFKRKNAMDSVAQSAPAAVQEDDSTDTKKLEARLERLRKSLLDEQTLESEAWFERQTLLDEALDQDFISREQHAGLVESLESEHMRRLATIRFKGMSEIEKFNAKSWDGQAKQLSAGLEQMTRSSAQHNRTMFNVNKGAAIANAVVDTYRGVTRTLAEYPYPYNLVMAAGSLAAGLSQVNAIKSTSFGGGGASATLGGGGGAPSAQAATAAPAAAQPGVATQQTQPSQNVTVNVQNGVGNKEYWQELVDDVIVPGINDAQKRNVNITVREF